MNKASRDQAYFEALYTGNPDPWDFETSAYEAQKYDSTMAALGGRRFGNGLEIGCSIGVLTARLAAICDRLLAADIVEAALTRAQSRCAGLEHVRFENRLMPRDWPDSCFDLIVLSEILYFLSPEDIRLLAARAACSLAADGIVLLVNYTEAIDEPCNGNDAAEIFIAASGLTRTDHVVRPKYRIDRLQPGTR
jgi:cyclopropane fatty-acyl-phospholipid synthase-like methyltransferase